jgi:hypothetical protein
MSLEATLAATGLPVSSAPYTGTATSYITYNMVNEDDTAFADAEAVAGERMYSVDYFTKSAWRSAIDTIKAAIKSAGYHIQSVGPEIFETDTKLFHIPILIVEDM